jgi:hypothetical protein
LKLHLGQPLPRLARPDRQLLIQYVCATQAGRLTQTPAAFRDDWAGGFVEFRPLRRAGEQLELSHSNKDYLGVIRALGNCETQLQARVTGVLAGLSWGLEA